MKLVKLKQRKTGSSEPNVEFSGVRFKYKDLEDNLETK